MRRPVSVAPPKGKLGILTPGMGAVSTTFMAGVELVRRGHSIPVGSLTQMGTIRLGKRTDGRTPKIKDFIKLAKLEDLVFGGWDVFSDDAYQAALKAGVLDAKDLAKAEKFLKTIKPMKAVFDQNYVKNLHGTHIKKGKNKFDLAQQLRQDIRDFKKKNKCDRLVMVWCASTEVFLKPEAVHKTLESFEKGMKENHPAIAPSMIYAYASIAEGVPFANGAPNLTVDIAAREEFAGGRQGFQNRANFDQDGSGAGVQGAHAGAERLVFDEYSGQSRRRSAGRSGIIQDQGRIEAGRGGTHFAAGVVSGAVRQDLSQGSDQLLPAAWRQQGRLGKHRHFRVAELSDADQGRFLVPRFDSGSADRAGPGVVF